MFGDSNSSALQEQVLDLTDRIYNSWVNWVSTKNIEIILPNKICLHGNDSAANFCTSTQLNNAHVLLRLAMLGGIIITKFYH